jgi:phosphonopyruvate decarboxylase
MKESGIEFITGVPDSLLKDICFHIQIEFLSTQHVIATNEGSAVALAIGHYLSTGSPALVYMQNSGLGNAINPLVSLADSEIYGIPMILLIGWRGEVGHHGEIASDEPQHRKQGSITLEQLKILDIPFEILNASTKDVDSKFKQMKNLAVTRGGPTALVVQKNTFKKFDSFQSKTFTGRISREEAIKKIVSMTPKKIPIVSSTGMISRELFELRSSVNLASDAEFFTIGGMGHASQIAAGIAMANPERKVVCLDGDGSVLMHAGALAISADVANLIHIVLNNGVHDSVGGQPTKGEFLRFDLIAQSFGYSNFYSVNNLEDLEIIINTSLKSKESFFIEVLCNPGSRKDLGRPTKHPLESKRDFMNFLRNLR